MSMFLFGSRLTSVSVNRVSPWDHRTTTDRSEAQYCNWQYMQYPAGNEKGNYPAYHGITGGLEARIACSHYTILAHAKVAKWYHEDFKGKGRLLR